MIQRMLCSIWLLPLLLLGCTTQLGAAQSEQLPGGGGNYPASPVEGFFEDLNRALADPNLRNYETRRERATQVASWFAPSERIRQRAAIERMFDEFIARIEQLEAEAQPGESTVVTFAITPQSEPRTLTQQESRATVLVDGVLLLRIVRVQGESEQLLYDKSMPVAELIGRPDGAIPVIRIDDRWFLSSS
jgi:hypothetical protein